MKFYYGPDKQYGYFLDLKEKYRPVTRTLYPLEDRRRNFEEEYLATENAGKIKKKWC